MSRGTKITIEANTVATPATSATKEARELPWAFLEDFPGLFEKGSDLDRDLLQRREWQEENPDHAPRVAGDWVRYGVLSQDELSIFKTGLSRGEMHGKMADAVDARFLSTIDYRLRFCRAILSIDYAIEWTKSGSAVWALEDPPEGDPLDALGVGGVNFAVGCREYYALKILRHFRRFEELYEAGKSDSLGVWRELILFGETWSDARFTLNLGKHTVTGKKQNKKLDEYREKSIAPRRESMQARREVIVQMLDQTNSTGGALEKHLKRRLHDEAGIHASLRSIRRDLAEIRLARK